MDSYYVYEIEYPEDGGEIIAAESEDDAKRLYNEHTGTPQDFDMLGIRDVCPHCGNVIDSAVDPADIVQAAKEAK